MSPERLACLECDLLVSLGELRPGERAACPRCGHLISARAPEGLRRATAFALAASVLLVMANVFPFLSLEASGLENVMTLPRAAVELYRQGYGAMAALVLGVILLAPALMIAALVALAVPLVNGRGAPWLVPAGRLLFWLSPWSMVEVFVIGVIVSLIKISHLAHVELGISFWSYVAFALCFTFAMASLDRLEVWSEIERHAS
jgi:paraquat-inducible protein A